MTKIKMSFREGERDREFYADMGPFFASRDVAKELGEPLYDEEGSLWLIGRKGKTVVGWSVFRIRKDKVGVFDWSYVIPDYRQQGIWSQLYDHKVSFLKDRGVERVHTATANSLLVKAYNNRGFTLRHTRGSWMFLEGSV